MNNSLASLYVELSELQPGQSIDRNTLLAKHSIPRRSGVRETTAAFREATGASSSLRSADPLVLYLISLGIKPSISPDGRATFAREVT